MDYADFKALVQGTVDVQQLNKDLLLATVYPAGDMARKAPYDRDPLIVANYYGASLAAHGVTVRWTYTVPENRIAMHSVLFESNTTAIATAGRTTSVTHAVNIASGGDKKFSGTVHFSTTAAATEGSVTATFYVVYGDNITGRTYSNDTANHGLGVASLIMEFDE